MTRIAVDDAGLADPQALATKRTTPSDGWRRPPVNRYFLSSMNKPASAATPPPMKYHMVWSV